MKEQEKEGYKVYSLDADWQNGKVNKVNTVTLIGQSQEQPIVEEEVQPDGTVLKKMRFRVAVHTIKDRLLLELQILAGNTDIEEEKRQRLLNYIREIRTNIAAIEVQPPEADGQIQFAIQVAAAYDLSKEEKLEQTFSLLKNGEVGAVLLKIAEETPLYKRLRKKKKEKAQPITPDNIKISGAFVPQNFRTHKAAEQQRLIPAEELANTWHSYTGIEVQPIRQEYGIDMTERERKSLFAILHAFTQTNYEGHEKLYLEDALPKYRYAPAEVLKDVTALRTGKGKTIKALPQLRLTQAQYLRLCGIPEDRQSDRQEAIEALDRLGTEQHCFWWQRAAREKIEYIDPETGKVAKVAYETVYNEDGSVKKEDVSTVETVLKVNKVRDPKTNELLYYEVAPSLVLAQCLEGGDYLMYPYKLEREVVEKTKKRLKKYEARLLLWLAWKFEEARRHRHTLKKHGNEAALQKIGGLTPAEVCMDYESIALELGMPESLLKKNRKVAHRQLEKAYEIAKKAGFLAAYERQNSGLDRLIFNVDAYHMPAQRQAKSGGTALN